MPGLLGEAMNYGIGELDESGFDTRQSSFNNPYGNEAFRQGQSMMNIDSSNNVSLRNYYRRAFASSVPTVDTFRTMAAGSGARVPSATTLAYKQAAANASRMRDASTSAFREAYLSQMGVGAGLMGQGVQARTASTGQWNQAQTGKYQMDKTVEMNTADWGTELFKLGGGLLGGVGGGLLGQVLGGGGGGGSAIPGGLFNRYLDNLTSGFGGRS